MIGQDGLLLKGDGEIRALSGFPANSAMFEVTGTGVVMSTPTGSSSIRRT